MGDVPLPLGGASLCLRFLTVFPCTPRAATPCLGLGPATMRWADAAVPLFVIALVLLAFVHYISTMGDDTDATIAPMATSTLTITIPAFADGASIPATYTCDNPGPPAGGLSPALQFSG